MKIAVSTSWARRDETAIEMMKRAAALGFARFELGVRPREKDVEGILGTCRSNGWEIASLHNPVVNAHLPEELMRGDAISSSDEDLRRQAVADLIRTIEIAEEAGASVVVVHAGRVDLPGERTRRYKRLTKAIEEGDEKTRRSMLKKRLDGAPVNLDQLAASLEEVLARDFAVTVAVESRYHYDEIPIADELAWLFRRFETPRLGYWHDVGHCQVGEALGVSPHREWLERFEGRMVGLHLHDIVGMGDHRPVGTGNMDFAMVRSHVGEGVIPVIEPEWNWSPEELERSARNLAAMGFGEFP